MQLWIIEFEFKGCVFREVVAAEDEFNIKIVNVKPFGKVQGSDGAFYESKLIKIRKEK